MPTSGYSFTSSQISVRFRAPYITSSINQQYRGIVAAGVYEGFDAAPSVNELGLDLNIGPSGRSSAVVSSSLDAEAHVTVHLTSDLEVDLTAFASKTVAVAITGSYAFPSETSATVNVYDLATESPAASDCVLAEVDVPASGVIPAENIRLTNRTLPWDSRGRDATPMVSAVRNGGPLLAPSATGMPDFWEQEDVASEVVFDSSDAQTAPSGFNLSFRARKVVTGAGSVTGSLVQPIGLPIPAGRRVRLKAAYWPTVVPSSGTPVIRAVFSDFAGVLTATTELTLDGTTTGAWETYETFVALDVGTAPTVLKELRVDVTGVSYTVAGANSPIFYLADLDVQVEQVGTATDVLATQSGESHHTKVRVYEGAYPSAANVSLTFSQPSAGEYETALTPSIFPPSHTFRIGGNTQIDNDLTVLGSANIGLVFVNSLDTAAPPPALELNLGPTNATGVNISKVGAQTRVKGTLRVDQAVTIDGSLDVITAGTMTIGATATEIHVAAPGVNTIVEGNIIVKGTTFSSQTETVLISDSHLYLNDGWTVASAKKGGLVVNYLPTSTADTTASAYTTSTVDTVGSATFTAGDVVQISGSDKNDGLYVVASHIGNTLTIDTSAPVSDQWYQTSFVVAPSETATLTKVNVSLLRTGTTGAWEVSYGSTLADVTSNSKPVATAGGGGGGGSGEIAFFDGSTLISDANLSYVSNNLLLGTTLNPNSARLRVVGGRIEHESDRLDVFPGTGNDYVFGNQDGRGYEFMTDSYSHMSMAIGSGFVGINSMGVANVPLRVQQANANDVGLEVIRINTLPLAAIQSFNRTSLAFTPLGYVGSQHVWYEGGTAAGNEIARFDASGKLGLGLTTPSVKLEVLVTSKGVSYFRTTDTGVSNQIAFANASNFAAGVMGTVNGTGVSGADVYGLGYAPTPSTDDFTPVVQWSSSGEVGVNSTPISGVSLRVQGTGSNTAGLEVVSGGASTVTLESFNRSTSALKTLAHNASDYRWDKGIATRMQIDVDGNVGINSSTVASVPLRVQQAGNADAGFEVQRISATSIATVAYNRTTSAYVNYELHGLDIQFKPSGTISAVVKSSGTLVVGGDDGTTGPRPNGTIRGANISSATNSDGGDLIIQGGNSTGTGIPGLISLQVATAGTVSGSSPTTPSERVQIGGGNIILTAPVDQNHTIQVNNQSTDATHTKTTNIGTNGVGTNAINIGSNATGTTTIVIGSASGASSTTVQGSVITLAGLLNANHTISIGNAASTSGTKTVVIGTNGASGSTTSITIGSTAGTSTTTMNGLVSFDAGTVSAPSIRFDADTDSGIYSPAAGQIATTANGVQRLLVSDAEISLIPSVSTNNTTNIATQATTAGISKTINIGSGASVASAPTTINIGNDALGLLTVNIGGGTGGNTRTINIGTGENGSGTLTTNVNIATGNGTGTNFVTVGKDLSDTTLFKSQVFTGTPIGGLFASTPVSYWSETDTNIVAMDGAITQTSYSHDVAFLPRIARTRRWLVAKNITVPSTLEIPLILMTNGGTNKPSAGSGYAKVTVYSHNNTLAGNFVAMVINYGWVYGAAGVFTGSATKAKYLQSDVFPAINADVVGASVSGILQVNFQLDFPWPTGADLSVIVDFDDMTNTQV